MEKDYSEDEKFLSVKYCKVCMYDVHVHACNYSMLFCTYNVALYSTLSCS